MSACPWSSAISKPQPLSLPDALLPDASLFACSFEPARPDLIPLELPPELRRAVPKRQTEYLAGRWCVQNLYHHSGLNIPPPAYSEQGGPVWPQGWSGSITHTHNFAAAALAPSSQIQTVGIDAEYLIKPDTAARVRDSILHPQEASLLDEDWISTLTLIFSFKESLYKALNPILKRFIAFEEVAVTQIGPDSLSFTPQGALQNDFPAGAPQTARWLRQDQLILTSWSWPV